MEFPTKGVGGVGTTSKHKRSSAASGRANDKSDVDHVTSQGEIKPIGGGQGHVEQERGGRIPVDIATPDSKEKKFRNWGEIGGLSDL